mgnify:CR=1 FL=1
MALAITMSVVSLYYYLIVIKQLYMESPGELTPLCVPLSTKCLLLALLIGMVFLGVYPAPLMEAIQYASDVILSSNVTLNLMRI